MRSYLEEEYGDWGERKDCEVAPYLSKESGEEYDLERTGVACFLLPLLVIREDIFSSNSSDNSSKLSFSLLSLFFILSEACQEDCKR